MGIQWMESRSHKVQTAAGVFIVTSMFASKAHAQAIVTPIINYVTPLLFVVLSGLILAIGFQLFLSVLSIATGVSLIGNVEARRQFPETPSLIRRITTGMGLWSLITVSASLFAATVLSVRLSLLAGDGWIGIALGLVIWAAFFSLVIYFESKSVTSLLGGIASTAIGGFRGGVESMKNVFAASAPQVEELLQKNASSLRDELLNLSGAESLNDRIERSLSQGLAQESGRGLDFDQLRSGFAEFLSRQSSIEKLTVDQMGVDKKTVMELAARNTRFSRRDVKQIGRAFEDAQWVARSRQIPLEMRIQERVENYLRHAARENLSPDRIRTDLDRIFSEPSAFRELESSRSSRMNHDTLVAVLEARRDIDHVRAERIATDTENAVRAVLGRISRRPTATDVESAESTRQRVQNRITEFLNDIDRPEFDNGAVRQSVEHLFHDPALSPETLRQRTNGYDRGSLLRSLEQNESLSKEDVNRIISKIEDAKDQALAALGRAEKKLLDETEKAKASALHQAELVREATAASAWWLFATASASGLAAAIGGLIAVRP